MMTKPLKRVGDQCVSVTLSELLALSNSAKAFSLSALPSRASLSGSRESRLLARGMEFAESRRYQTGDDIRNMDWRVTARTGKAHTKLFTVEKERQVLLSIDMRSSMFFATQGVFKSVQAALMTGYVAWNAIQIGDRLGGLIFDDAHMQEYRPALRKKGILPLLNGVAERSNFLSRDKSPINLSDPSMIDDVVASLWRMASPGSLVFIMSDFRHLTIRGRDMLQQIAKRCDLCLCFLYDPLETNLPKNGYYPVTSGDKELQLNTYDKKNLERYQKQFLERRSRVATLANQPHVHFIECSTQDDCLEILQKHFNK